MASQAGGKIQTGWRMRFTARKIILTCGALFMVSTLIVISVGRMPSRYTARSNIARISDVKTFDVQQHNSTRTADFVDVTDSRTSEDSDDIPLPENRIGLLEEKCRAARNGGVKFDQNPRSMYYNDKYRFIFCAVPKVAATSWKRVLLVLNGDVTSVDGLHHIEVQHKHHYPTLKRLTNYEQQTRLASFTSFFFTREPFHRLLSAYRNKFEMETNNAAYRRTYGKYIIRKYRRTSQPFLSTKDIKVSFPEFVQYLIDPQTSTARMDMHWKPMYALCDVCNMRYDFIGKFEHLQEDALKALKLIHADHDVTFPDYDTHVTNSSQKDVYLEYYSKVPTDHLIRLYKKYELDFTLFGYEVPDIIKSRFPGIS